MSAVPLVRLADTVAMPGIGLGTYPMDDAEPRTAVRQALEIGYRLVDTAASYGNEVGVGRSEAQRQRANLAVFDFQPDDDELAAICALPQHRTGGDPETYEEF